MNDEFSRRLSELADKLNVSVEHLWGVLVKQAFIDGLSSLLTVVVCALLAVAAFCIFFYARRKFKTAEAEKSALYPRVPLDWIILGTVLLMIVMVAGSNLYWVVSDFTNPEYYALRQLPFPK
jgi:hypothetical protein